MRAALAAVALGLVLVVGSSPVAAAPPVLVPCLEKSSGARPSATADDLADCVYQRLDGRRVRVTVAYTYASPLGQQNIWLIADMVANRTPLKWFGVRPAPIAASRGTATLEIQYGYNAPPPTVTTDAIVFAMYVGGAQVFFRKAFALRLDWRL